MKPLPCEYCGEDKEYGGSRDGFAWYYCPVCDKIEKIEK